MFTHQEMDERHRWLPTTAPRALSDLPAQLRIFADEKLEIWYSPHGDPTPSPRICILGITPGWRQVRLAYDGATKAMTAGMSRRAAARLPKPAVPFAGSMRSNLNAMLDELGLPGLLGHDRANSLFGSGDLRTGSVLRYPVFRHGANYTGHTPAPLIHPALREMVDVVLTRELKEMGTIPILPLGKAVESVLSYCVERGRLNAGQVLTGFPHPSGANGHRHRQFARHRDALSGRLREWLS